MNRLWGASENTVLFLSQWKLHETLERCMVFESISEEKRCLILRRHFSSCVRNLGVRRCIALHCIAYRFVSSFFPEFVSESAAAKLSLDPFMAEESILGDSSEPHGKTGLNGAASHAVFQEHVSHDSNEHRSNNNRSSGANPLPAVLVHIATQKGHYTPVAVPSERVSG